MTSQLVLAPPDASSAPAGSASDAAPRRFVRSSDTPLASPWATSQPAELDGPDADLHTPNPGLALALQAAVLSHARCAPAATAFASELAAAFGCTRVTVGFVLNGYARLAAVSHGGDSRLYGEAFDPIAAAMDEALEQGCSITLPVRTDAASAIRMAHAKLTQRQGGAVASVPIVYLHDGVGAVTFEWAMRPAGFEPVVAEIEHLVSLVGPVLHLMHLREAPLRMRLLRALRRQWQRLKSPAGARLRLALAAGTVALGGLLLVPVDYRVGGKARIEGEAQRALVAPVDGFLKAAAVRPGDRVKQGQVLIELADQDLMLEHRKWASEQSQQQSAYATALTRSERPAMVIALAKADEARARLGMIEAQLERARIVAPFDGIVLQGDLSQGLGAPVERGKVLMTLAPGERHRVVVEVDERDIADVRVGQAGSLSLSALPWDVLPIRVVRVTPIAKSVDGANVFEVETEVTAGPDRIRPGLEGVAKIEVGRQTIAWAWFHRLGDWLRLSVWSWLP
ncbi:hypothetical protein BH11PSE9_BH11PSE9_07070 [soil metagenome]